MNDNGNMSKLVRCSYSNAVKEMHRIKAYLKKEENSQIHNLNAYIKKLENQRAK